MGLVQKIPIRSFKVKTDEKIYLSITAIFIGFLTGVAAVGVNYAIKFFSYIFYGGAGVEIFRNTAIWKILLIPTIIGFIVGWIINRFAKETKGSGVPEIILSVLINGGKIRKRVPFIKAFVSILSISSGGSVGAEGPQAYIGASISSIFSKFITRKEDFKKVLVAAGAGSGIAAAFNTPMAGALFAAEVILGDFSVATFSPIIVSTVTATLVSQYFLGSEPLFTIPAYSITGVNEVILYVILGVLAGFISLLFIWSLFFTERYINKIPKIKIYFKTAIAGFILGAIGLLFPEGLGTGIEAISLFFTQHFKIEYIIGLLFIKILLTNLSIGGGFSGGIFAPSLFIGGALGAIFGEASNLIFNLTIPIPIWSVVGMSAVVSGTTQAPITAMMIIFELSQSYNLLLPLIITSMIASLITSTIKNESIYTQKLILKGFDLNSKGGGVEKLTIEPFIDKNFEFFTLDCNLNHIVGKLIHSNQHIFPVVNNKTSMKLRGVISIDDIKYIFEQNSDPIYSQLLIAGDLMEGAESIFFNESFLSALDIFADSKYRELPVVDTKDRVMGIIDEHKILSIYNSENQKKVLANALVQKRNFSDPIGGIPIGDSIYIQEISIPKKFHYKKIKDLLFRNQFHLEIILIKNNRYKTKIFPYGDYVVKDGDHFVVLGKGIDIKNYIDMCEFGDTSKPQ